MDGLDLLKQHWNKDNNFPKVDKEQIKSMLYKSSSSIVKWIFIISVIELALGIVWGFVLPTEDRVHTSFYDIIYIVFSVVFYVVIGYFIYNFFASYRNIKNTTNTKILLETILNTRKHVNHYIQFNIYSIIFMFAFVTIDIMMTDLVDKSPGNIVFKVIFMVLFISLFCWLFILIVKVYYKILYRRLVRKLDKNYEELVRIEEES
ncbi:hypothetical protein [Sphingobacterium deserti]|uniref:Membrane protein n=1 Tax=Sphingobacterium deserti TaxID=1229276 RepID=A0A0B8T1Y5_9SPHI|nr:hypothetical protein [Sphingobacterium deserti]KGE14786.1 membrane protein [Sphingobacterium deserti]